MVSPAGEILQQFRLKDQKPTNVAFGGDDGQTLYISPQYRGAIERVWVRVVYAAPLKILFLLSRSYSPVFF